jgi:gamma-glutamyl hydrolase
MMSHVKYLEAAGARVVPISYRLDKNGLINLLQQVNGIYIPGDHPDVLKNERYLNTVREILFWAQDHNIAGHHFPLVAVSYGYLAVMM